jgi:DNA polymerase III alpha subunit
MNQNKFGDIILEDSELFDLIYKKDLNINFIKVSKSLADQFNSAVNSNADYFNQLQTVDNYISSINEFDQVRQNNWLLKYDTDVDLKSILYDQCHTDQEKQRVDQEWDLFVKYDLINLLHFLRHLVKLMRQNNIVWGLGRGSSVSSFILYLLGVHKINSIKYNLDINEFLK